MKVLHLTLKKKWFDMILSGEKKEEYRECKYYWFRRLTEEIEKPVPCILYRKFDIVRFRNGYAKDAPTFDIECLGITEGYGKRSWGSAGRYVYIIKLGNILCNRTPNCYPRNKGRFNLKHKFNNMINIILWEYYNVKKGRKEILNLMANPFTDMFLFLRLEEKLNKYDNRISDIERVLN